MTSILEELLQEYADSHRNRETAKLVPLRDVMLGTVQPILLMLLSGAGLLLVIACINVVSLLLAPRSQPHAGVRRPQCARRLVGATGAAGRNGGVRSGRYRRGPRINSGLGRHAVPHQPAQ